MNDCKMEHNLMEYVLTLLSVPGHDAMEIEDLIEHVKHSGESYLLDLPNIWTAQEMIKFMDEMPGGFLIYHADEKEEIIYANKALLRIFQCDTLQEFREFTGNSFKGIVYSEDLDAVELSIQEQVASSQYDLDYVEYRIVRKDGTICWIEDYGHFVHCPSVGDIFYVFMGDATEKRNQQLEKHHAILHEKEHKLQNLIDKFDKERTLINQEHLRRLEVIEGLSINYESILYANLDNDKIFPYRLSSRTKRQFQEKYQTLGFHWYLSNYVNTWVHPEDREEVAKMTSPAYMRKKLSNNKTYYINYRVLIDNETQYLQLRIVNVSKRDHISQIVMGYRRVDVEVRREMEQNQILEDALNAANLAIIAKNTFLSNMSHDMRTPLNAIFGYTALARKHLDDRDMAEKYLNKIERSSRQLFDLIQKVLDLSWTESNDIQLNEGECILQDILREVHEALFPLTLEKNIAFTLDSSGLAHGNVVADHEKLKQALLYLVNNAVTYTKESGKVELTVSEPKTLSNQYAVYQFTVKDTGIGIGRDFLEHIFEPFEREKNTTFSGIHGTGLSLTIAKKIITMMGGEISVDSAVGKGSTFTVTLRLKLQDHPNTCCDFPENAAFSPRIQKILLVEDNMINLEIETEILQDLGFLIETATDGSIAVEKIANSTPGDFDLVLMDIQMPVMDGRQAATEIRRLKNQELAQIPIIALSANAFESDKRMSIESGMDAHLTKPIDIPLLLETIGSVSGTSPSKTS